MAQSWTTSSISLTRTSQTGPYTGGRIELSSSGFFQVSILMEGFDDLLAQIGVVVEGASAELAQSVYEMWYDLASRRLRSSRVRYLAALQPPQVLRSGLAYEVSLVGDFPVMVEEGVDSYDVGAVILKGREYVRVPFKQNPSTAGFGASSTPMGYGYRASARGSGQKRYRPGGALREAAKMHKSLASSKRTRKRLGLPKLPGDPWRMLGAPGVTRNTAQNLGKLRPHHSRPIYAGQQAAASGVGGVTFRTVNQNSNWIHPGIQARHFAERVKQRFDSVAGAIVSKHVQMLGGSGP